MGICSSDFLLSVKTLSSTNHVNMKVIFHRRNEAVWTEELKRYQRHIMGHRWQLCTVSQYEHFKERYTVYGTASV